MTQPRETTIDTPRGPMRVWKKGKGKRVGVFAGIGGQPRWTPFLDALADSRQVIVPSLPGFPGGPSSDGIDGHLDWIVAARDAMVAAGLSGADLVGASVGGALAAELASLWPDDVRRLALIAPFGLFDEAEPMADIFAQPPGGLARLVSNKPETFDAFLAMPEGANKMDWDITSLRARVAAASLIWPLGDTGLITRVSRLTAQTLILQGDQDRVIPAAYAKRLAKAINGKTKVRTIKNAGHVAECDQPAATAKAILSFLDA